MDPSLAGGAIVSAQSPTPEAMTVVSSANDNDVRAMVVGNGAAPVTVNSSADGGHGSSCLIREEYVEMSPDPAVNAAVVAARAATMASALSAIAALVVADVMEEGHRELRSTPSDAITTSKSSSMVPTSLGQGEVPQRLATSTFRLFSDSSPWPPERVAESTIEEPSLPSVPQLEGKAKEVAEKDTPIHPGGGEKLPPATMQRTRRTTPRGKNTSSWKQSWRPVSAHRYSTFVLCLSTQCWIASGSLSGRLQSPSFAHNLQLHESCVSGRCHSVTRLRLMPCTLYVEKSHVEDARVQ